MERFFDVAEDFRGGQGVTAKIEEIIVNSDGLDLECGPPYFGETMFHPRVRCNVRRR